MKKRILEWRMVEDNTSLQNLLEMSGGNMSAWVEPRYRYDREEIVLLWQREETDAEYDARLKEEAENEQKKAQALKKRLQAKQSKKDKEEREERELYEKLKQKYEGW
jgi:hypothetical protein